MPAKRSDLLAHLRRTRFAPGDKAAARADADRIAAHLKTTYGARVWGIGSLFEVVRDFRKGSDIDLVVEGVPADRYLEALEACWRLSTLEVDLIPRESANDLVRQIVAEDGVPL